jgi:pathogenesis-related protein 1
MTHRISWVALFALLIAGTVGSVVGVSAAQVTPAQQTAMLAAHNTLRQNTATAETQRLGQTVTIPDLTWNPTAAATAQAWANNLLATNTFAHNPNAPEFGENIFFESGPDPATSGDRAFTSWASEAASYTWDTNACTADCTHYTQIIWAASTSVGCGMATNGTTTIWVCDYAPRGNIDGQRPYEPGGPMMPPPMMPPTTMMPPTGTIAFSKSIVDANGNPVGGDRSGFQITISGPNGFNQTVTTEPNSFAALRNLAAGTYTITEQPRAGFTFESFRIRGVTVPNGATVTLADGETMAVLVVNRTGTMMPPPTMMPPTMPPLTMPPPATTGGTGTVSGSWMVADFGWGVGGTLVLRQDGNQVTGTYTYADPSGCGTQRGTVTGALALSMLILTYTETGCGGDDAGVVQLMLSASGASFSGDWNGTRAAR